MTQIMAQVDKLLSGVSNKVVPTGMICELALPVVVSKQNSGLLGQYGNAHLRIEKSLIGGKGKFRRVQTLVTSTTTYHIKGHGYETLVTKEDKRNYDDPFDAEADETEGVTTKLYVEKEKNFADAVSNTSIMTQNTTLSGTDQFSDYANSNPIEVFRDAKADIRAWSGGIADTVMLDYDVFEVLRYHPQLLDALGYKFDRPGGLGADELAKALGLRRVLIAQGIYNASEEGEADNLQPIWGKHIILGICPEKAAKNQISLGYRFQIDGSAPRKVYKQTSFNPPGATEILVEDEYDMLISNAKAGFLMKNAIA